MSPVESGWNKRTTTCNGTYWRSSSVVYVIVFLAHTTTTCRKGVLLSVRNRPQHIRQAYVMTLRSRRRPLAGDVSRNLPRLKRKTTKR
jgi:hypothetical protein